MNKIKTKIIVIVGPTASGKSDLAIRLARKFKGEIISADSRQVYRGMDIGTGKLSKREQRIVPHHLLDVASPKKIFTAADFKSKAQRAIAGIIKRGKFPIIVGGTGQYIDTLVYDLALPEVPPNYKLRAKLEKQTTEQLFNQLQKLDPERAANIDRHNPRRLIRALEIIAATGKPVGAIQKDLPYEILWLGLNPKDLDKRIKTRLQKRFKQGMVSEVQKLLKQRVSEKRLFEIGLGYRIIPEYLKGKISAQEMQIQVTLVETQYAKRQMTWFKRNQEIHWLKKEQEAEKLTKAFV